ncbi:hypothetical protein E1B28_001002 [Marasmius oreades]|uniref:Uncharacterized protein n=1 Tax=Marasmius oreades TaxID=181124 RepID=A0A9P7V2I0_9AGAR|nr:uncharacterized protein E1B28_001002 [Marasmius oreades]KAG7099130.1 hypothetical protein E1B28_001002 [Marasmius oreades]
MNHAACISRSYHQSSLSFFHVFQSAASRAWCRTVSSAAPRDKPGLCPSDRSLRKQIQPAQYISLLPQQDRYASRSSNHTPQCYLSQPESRRELYRGLVELHSSRRINLPKLIDYHDRYAPFRSTRSFNFLISLALRHVSFGTVRWLFRAMESANIEHNLETRKLLIRWYVAIGLWDRAWRELKQIETPGRVPEALWLEFFKGLRRGVGFKRLIHPTERSRTQDYHPVLLYARRFVLLMESQPVLRESTRPKVVHFVVHALLQMRQRKDALSLTRRYLDCVSREPSMLRDRPMNLVHLFVAFGSSQRGLRRFHEARQLLMSFLLTYPFLVPTPTTLFLLLGNLRRARKCGTVGMECFVFFKRKWGKRVDDERVRRRLGSLAVKEGRKEIVESLLGTTEVTKGQGKERKLWKQMLRRLTRRLFG